MKVMEHAEVVKAKRVDAGRLGDEAVVL